jgi:uncharacterized phage-associated protein
MNFPFDETKATQAAAWLISKAGGKLSHIKLSKLLYLVDREAINRWGRPVIGGMYSSMPHGPVISPIVDCLKPSDERPEFHFWDSHLERKGNDVILRLNPGRGQLHDAAIKLMEEIFEKFRNQTKWQVRQFTHTLPEYKDTQNSSYPIKLDALLSSLNKTSSEIEVVRENAKSMTCVKRLIGC